MDTQPVKHKAQGRYVKPAPGNIYVKCMYPPCNTKTEVPDPKTTPAEKQKPPFCDYHMELVAFCMWLLPRIEVKKQETPHGIVLPGHKDFKAEFQPGRGP